MRQNSVLNRSDYEYFLIVWCFGFNPEEDYLLRCIKSAYRDFSRTLHGIQQIQAKENLDREVRSVLKHELSGLPNLQPDQQTFDDWHHDTCKRLSEVYSTYGYHSFLLGQAQKWINMTLKYIYLLGEERVPGYASLYSYCHMPIDRIIVDRLAALGSPVLSKSWSRIDDYDEYWRYQNWIREHFDLGPLDVEFFLWLGKEFPETARHSE
jgi:hypothetical protein